MFSIILYWIVRCVFEWDSGPVQWNQHSPVFISKHYKWRWNRKYWSSHTDVGNGVHHTIFLHGHWPGIHEDKDHWWRQYVSVLLYFSV